ncbi:MAG: PQQ-binding-like beta-propeller repeat protein [Pirellulales bacterium]
MAPLKWTLSAFAVVAFTTSIGRADVWPQFRGPRGDGLSAESNLPTKWSEKEGTLWKTDLPGRSNSSPAVTKNRIDLTTQMPDDSLWVVSIDRRNGKIVRKLKVGSGTLATTGPAKLYAYRHNAATPSPVSDEDNIWAFFGTGLLVCIDAGTGEMKWRRDLVSDYGKYNITFGMGSSPRLWGNAVYIACMTKGASYVVAVDKKTGKEIWKTDRKLPAKDDGPDAYSTPVVLNIHNQDQLVVTGSDHVNAYGLLTGKQLWITDGLMIDSPYGRIIASAVAEEGVVVATSGNPAGAGKGHIMAVRPGQGDVRATKLWKHGKSTPDSASPVCVNGKVYALADAGIVTCLDLGTGKVDWVERLGKGPFHASIVAGDGKLYCLSIEGNCTVMQAGSEAKVLSTNKLSGTFYATPAISDGVLYLRAYERLYAIQ